MPVNEVWFIPMYILVNFVNFVWEKTQEILSYLSKVMLIALSTEIYFLKKIILIFTQIWWLIESIFCSQFVFSEIGTKEFLIIYLFSSFLAQSGFANIREDPVLISFEVGENHQNCLENYILVYWFLVNFDSHVKEENHTIASHIVYGCQMAFVSFKKF